MNKVVSLRLKDVQHARLERLAKRRGRPLATVAAEMVEEKLREDEFPDIEIRDTAVGPQAYLRGTRIQAWMVAMLLGTDGDLEGFAKNVDVPAAYIRSALAYAEAFPEEIAAAIAESHRNADQRKGQTPPDQAAVTRASPAG